MRVDPHAWLSDGMGWTLVAVVALTLSLLMTSCAPLNLDVNGYHDKPAKPGSIHCAGNC